MASPADAGLTYKQVHEARQFRNAEATDPGIVRRTIDERQTAGQEPTRAAVREAVQGRGPSWSRSDVIPSPRRAPAITGDRAVFHAIEDGRRAIEPLGDAVAAIIV